jgi:hypothetical protein
MRRVKKTGAKIFFWKKGGPLVVIDGLSNNLSVRRTLKPKSKL